jgi:hypothetical protein
MEDQGGVVKTLQANNRMRPQPLKRSSVFTFRQCLAHKQLTLRFFFSASSFYPNRGPDTSALTVLSHIPARTHSVNQYLIDPNDGDTEVESEGEWLTEPQLAEPTGRTSAKTLEAMLIEVSTSFFSVSQK